MKQKRMIIVCLNLTLLTGCTRYYDWGKKQFEQAVKRDSLGLCVSNGYVVSTDQYEIFSTIAHFDILWFAKPVADMYAAHLLEQQGGESDARYDQLVRELYDELDSSLVFYLIMNDCAAHSLQKNFSLNKADMPLWSATLEVDDEVYLPSALTKITQVPAGLAAFFATRYDPHYRLMYKITFPCSTPGLSSHAKANKVNFDSLRIVLRSVKHQVSIAWDPHHLQRNRLLIEQVQ